MGGQFRCKLCGHTAPNKFGVISHITHSHGRSTRGRDLHKEWEELDPSWDDIQSTLESGAKADLEPKIVENGKHDAEIINTKNAKMKMKGDDGVTTHEPVEKEVVENEKPCKAQKTLKPIKFPTFGRTEYRTRARSRMGGTFVQKLPEPITAATVTKKHKLVKNKEPTVVAKMIKLDEDKLEFVPTNENIVTEKVVDKGKDNLPSSDDVAKSQDMTTHKLIEEDVVTNGETCEKAQLKTYPNKIHMKRFLAKKNNALENRVQHAKANLVTPVEPTNTAEKDYIPAVSPAKLKTPEKQVAVQINRTPDKEIIAQLNKTPTPDKPKQTPDKPKAKLDVTNLASPIAETIKTPDNRENHTITAAKVVNNKSPEKQQPFLIAKHTIDNNVPVNQEDRSRPNKPNTKTEVSDPIEMKPLAHFLSSKQKLGRRRLLDPAFTCPYCGRTHSSNWNLKLHIRSHTGEKPFKCVRPGCQMAYAAKQQLQKHLTSKVGCGILKWNSTVLQKQTPHGARDMQSSPKMSSRGPIQQMLQKNKVRRMESLPAQKSMPSSSTGGDQIRFLRIPSSLQIVPVQNDDEDTIQDSATTTYIIKQVANPTPQAPVIVIDDDNELEEVEYVNVDADEFYGNNDDDQMNYETMRLNDYGEYNDYRSESPDIFPTVVSVQSLFIPPSEDSTVVKVKKEETQQVTKPYVPRILARKMTTYRRTIRFPTVDNTVPFEPEWATSSILPLQQEDLEGMASYNPVVSTISSPSPGPVQARIIIGPPPPQSVTPANLPQSISPSKLMPPPPPPTRRPVPALRPIAPQPPTNIVPRATFKCPSCLESFPTMSSMIAHFKGHGSAFICQFCSAGFNTSKLVRRHQARAHSKSIITFKCPLCPKRYSNEFTLNSHLGRMHRDKTGSKQRRENLVADAARDSFAAAGQIDAIVERSNIVVRKEMNFSAARVPAPPQAKLPPASPLAQKMPPPSKPPQPLKLLTPPPSTPKVNIEKKVVCTSIEDELDELLFSDAKVTDDTAIIHIPPPSTPPRTTTKVITPLYSPSIDDDWHIPILPPKAFECDQCGSRLHSEKGLLMHKNLIHQ